MTSQGLSNNLNISLLNKLLFLKVISVYSAATRHVIAFYETIGINQRKLEKQHQWAGTYFTHPPIRAFFVYLFSYVSQGI
jgi:hypothetical protein